MRRLLRVIPFVIVALASPSIGAELQFNAAFQAASKIAPKSDFETQSDFEYRVGSSLPGEFSVRYKPRYKDDEFYKRYMNEIAYDPESRTLTVKIKGASVCICKFLGDAYDPRARHILYITFVERGSSGSYIGQNAFGAKAKVTSHLSHDRGVAVINAPSGSDSEGETIAKVALTDIDSEKAKSIIKRGYFILTFNPALPSSESLPARKMIANDLNGSTATIDKPTESFTYTALLSAKLTRVRFFDGANEQPIFDGNSDEMTIR